MLSLRSWSPIHAVKNMSYVMDHVSRAARCPRLCTVRWMPVIVDFSYESIFFFGVGGGGGERCMRGCRKRCSRTLL